MGRRSPQSVLKRAREQALREKRERKEAKRMRGPHSGTLRQSSRSIHRGGSGRRVTRFDAGEPEGAVELEYEQALEALLTMIGRQVLVLFSGSDGSPFIAGIVSGRLDRGELDERLQEVLLRADDASVETLFFHVGSRQSGFVIRPDEFECGFWRGDTQLVLRVGHCAITVLAGGELGRVLER